MEDETKSLDRAVIKGTMFQAIGKGLKWIGRTVREALSEPGPTPGTHGTLSWGRVAATICLIASIVWVTRVAFHTWSIPALDGITGFVLAPYAANKVATAAQSFSSNPVNPPAPPTPPQP